MASPGQLALRFRYGRWIGRRSATVAGAHGIPPYEARRILAERARVLSGPKLAGYWTGVSEVRPEWGMAGFDPD